MELPKESKLIEINPNAKYFIFIPEYVTNEQFVEISRSIVSNFTNVIAIHKGRGVEIHEA